MGVDETARPEQLVASWADRQHGLVTRGQALASGVTRDALEGRIRRGTWRTVHRGVYRLPGSGDTREQRIMAACLAAGGTSVASHRSAGWLWGLIPPGAMVVEITVTRSRGAPRLNGVVVHTSRDHQGTSRRNRGIPLASPLDTVVQLASVLPGPDLHRVLDAAARLRLLGGADLLQHLSGRHFQGAAGIKTLRQVLADRGHPGTGTSALERRMLGLLRLYRLPLPSLQMPVGPGHRYRADMTWPPSPILVELDGFDTHGTPEALAADLARQNELIAAGYDLRRYTWGDLTRRPAGVMDEVAAALDHYGLLAPRGRRKVDPPRPAESGTSYGERRSGRSYPP